MITEDEYVALAGPELRQLLDAFDRLDTEDIEAELESDILTVEFEDGEKYVINSHRAARQIWMAAERNAWHFDWSSEKSSWIATKSGDELWSTLERVLTNKLGRPVSLR
jgi:CyaY protein